MNERDELMHYGMPRRSGRYPWGSGKEPYQHSGDWLSRVETLKKKGLDQKAIIEQMNSYNKDHGYDILSTTELRTLNAIASNQRSMDNIRTAHRLAEKEGLGVSEIAAKMGQPWSTVKGWLNEDEETSRRQVAFATKEFLKDQIEKKEFIDVGKGAELAASTAQSLDVSADKLTQALYMLELDEGCRTVNIGVPQATQPGQQTVVRVLCKPGFKTDKEAQRAAYQAMAQNKIQTLEDLSEEYYTNDNGDSWHPQKFEKPVSIDPKRIHVRYAGDAKDGGEHGELRDGVIEIRRTPDLDLGNQNYAQVRIMVDNSHYIKGMAVAGDDKDFPPGCDIIVNSNKPRNDPKTGTHYSLLGDEKGSGEYTKSEAVLKPIKSDPNDPFGAAIMAKGQHYYVDPKTGKKLLSPVNKIKEEGDWDNYNNSIIAAQFLSKQSKELIKRQIDISVADKKEQLETIQNINNPTVRKKMLIDYADACDKTASDLETVALPRQKWHVILPINSLKDDEVFAPNYKDGEKVALVRYPHGGIFEMPICTVNNKNRDARKWLRKPDGTLAEDVVGINKKTAERLSGADFDGDTVIVIPTGNKVKIQNKKPLPGLEGFDTTMAYPQVPGCKLLQKNRVGAEMGAISNLITDMTIQGAPDEELERAVRHSMVIIDANKHKLNYKQSEIDNGILELKKKYQGHLNEKGNYSTAGNTLLTRAGSEVRIPKRKGQYKINIKGTDWYDPSRPEGVKLYKEDPATYMQMKKDKDGKRVPTGKMVQRQDKVTQMSLVDDARLLSSGTPKEELYANYANSCKALANQARKEAYSTPLLERNPSAAKTYEAEVASLNAKLNEAKKNKPRERKANIMAYSIVRAQLQDNPDMESKDIKKANTKAIEKARVASGAQGKKYRFNITDREWEAIQAGAISDHKLSELLNAADQDRVKELAYPKKDPRNLSQVQMNKIKLMSTNFTQAEIAEQLGVSVSTVSKYLHS